VSCLCDAPGAETGSNIDKWLSSPGLRPPEALKSLFAKQVGAGRVGMTSRTALRCRGTDTATSEDPVAEVGGRAPHSWKPCDKLQFQDCFACIVGTVCYPKFPGLS
jgi:hypothetical protein